MQSNMLIISECCRALGNLSHYPEVEAIFSNGADQILHQLLDSSDINLVVNVIGIFINFSLVKSDLKVFDQSEVVTALTPSAFSAKRRRRTPEADVGRIGRIGGRGAEGPLHKSNRYHR